MSDSIEPESIDHGLPAEVVVVEDRTQSCSHCGKGISHKAHRCKHCKRRVKSKNFNAAMLSYASLLVYGGNRKLILGFLSILTFYMLVDAGVFLHFSKSKLVFNVGYILGNSLTVCASYVVLVLVLFLILKLFQAPANQLVVRRAHFTLLFSSFILFAFQAYHFEELAREQLLIMTFKMPFSPVATQKAPHVLGSAEPDFLALFSEPQKAQVTQLPLHAQGNHLLLEARVQSPENYHYKGTFLLDTGATHTILFKSFLKKNNLSLPPNTRRMNFQGVTGNSSAPLIYADLSLGRITVRNVLVMVVDDPSVFLGDGVLGMNVLQQFKMELDPQELKLTLKQ